MSKYHHQDRLFRQAKDDGLRSRAAYKIEELDKRHRLLSSGMSVLDLGCAPGGWLVYAAQKVGASGTVVGVDIEAIPPLVPGELDKASCVPLLIVGDALESNVQEQLRSCAPNGYDLILSDMSPKLSGIKDRDNARSVELVEIAFSIARSMLRQGGGVVAKAFPSADVDASFRNLSGEYLKVQRVYLKASRKTSKELYLLAQGFNGCRA